MHIIIMKETILYLLRDFHQLSSIFISGQEYKIA